MQEHDAQNPRQFPGQSSKGLTNPKVCPWWVPLIHATMCLVYVTHSEWHVCKSTPLRLQYMPPTASDMYARACHYVSNTCHPRWVICMQEQAITSLIRATHSECHVCKSTTHALHIRLNKAPHLVILTGSQNPRPVLGKPRRSSTGLKKPRANMSLVQGSKNPRFTLGEPFLLLSSISTRTQGTQGLPLTIFSIPNFYLYKNSSLSKTQGPPLVPKNPRSTLVRTPTKPKVPTWSAHSQQLWWPPPKVQVQQNELPPDYFGNTFNQVEVILTPHNH